MATGLPEQFHATREEIERFLSSGLTQEAINSTDLLVENIDQHIPKLERGANKLGDAIYQSLPKLRKRRLHVAIGG